MLRKINVNVCKEKKRKIKPNILMGSKSHTMAPLFNEIALREQSQE